MKIIIEILSWFIGRRPFLLLAAKIAEKYGDYKDAGEFENYANR